MADLRSILTDPNYTNANLATKQAIFERYSQQDPNYVNANEATKQAIRAKYGVAEMPVAQPMATPEELEAQALAIAGGTEAAQPPAQPAEFSPPRAAAGALETLLTLGTGATTGTLGYAAGAGAGALEQALAGEFGTPEAARAIAERAAQGMQQFTYQPRTPEAQAGLAMIGEAAEGIVPLAPVVPVGTISTPIQQATQVARASLPGASQAVTRTAQTVAERLSRAPEVAAAPGSVGAAATEQALQRATTAEMMPVPFAGPSELTLGQASRNFQQLQFEKEAAKLAEMGAPLRERTSNQSLTLLQNFDAIVDSMEPIRLSKPEIGLATTEAIQNKANVVKERIRKEYKKAREAGETEELVLMAPLAAKLEELDTSAGIVPLIAGLRQEAERLGAVVTDETGKPVPQQFSINDAETLRQWLNKRTNWKDEREALFSSELKQAIDDSTEPAGGEIYKRARKMRKEYADEFQNVGLTAALIGKKGKTSERKIALENVFDKVIRLSPVEEMNKVRGTLLSAGPEGKQAWFDLKAKGIDLIKETAMTTSRDERGNFMLSPAKLHKTIKSMDDTGKLEALYGKKTAQTMRDLAEIALDIYTAPPGAVNMSNTSSALQNAFDTVLTFNISGLPVPAKKVLTEAAQYVRNRKIRARIKEALAGPKKETE